MLQNFFQDLKVIELASVLAGPAVGLFFAELGAEVIKIENKTKGGDVTRNWRLPNESQKSAYSAYFCSVNWQKKSLFLDLTQAQDQSTLHQLVAEADIVISNYKDTSAQKMACTYQDLQAINPRLIFAHLTSYGSDDSRPAFDVVLQAETGFLYMNGEADGNPVKMPVALIDILAAHQLKEAVLLALLHRERTGEGSYVTTSLLEAAIASLANQATNYLMVNHIPQRMGCLHPNIAPYGDIFSTKDKKSVILAVGTERQWLQLCKSLDLLEVTEDIRFQRNIDRVQNRQALSVILSKRIQTWNRDALLAVFYKNGVPVGSVRDMQEVFQLEKAQNMILEEQMEDGTTSKRVKTVAFDWKANASK